MEATRLVRGQVCGADAAVALRLWDRLRADIDMNEVTSIFELETSLIPLMLDMKTKGVVSMSIRHTMCRRNQRREDALLEEVKKETGVLVSRGPLHL